MNGSELPSYIERAAAAKIGIVRPVGQESLAVISRLSPTEENPNFAGNILRRTCRAVGAAACQKECAKRGTDDYYRNADKLCADRNLAETFGVLGIDAQDVLMVAVSGDYVGYGDQLPGYHKAGLLKNNPEGWQELAGFNAFFAHPDEVPAIGSRLADCAHFEFEFKDRDGQTVIGFEHGTRPNMYGAGAYRFEADGQPASYTHHVLASAIRHYGADPASLKIRLSSSIKPENFVKHFDSREKMEAHIPGWLEAGFVRNVSNPDWQSGDDMVTEDEWQADARGLILHDIKKSMAVLGIPSQQFVCDDMLDPADSGGEYSSYENRGRYGDSRDLYLIAHCSAFKTGNNTDITP